MGLGSGDSKSAPLSGRRIRWHDWGISCRSDLKCRQQLMQAMGLSEEWKNLGAIGKKEPPWKEERSVDTAYETTRPSVPSRGAQPPSWPRASMGTTLAPLASRSGRCVGLGNDQHWVLKEARQFKYGLFLGYS